MPSHRLPTIIVLYDHDCPLQRILLLALKANGQLNQIKLINIRDAQFSAHAWGFAPEALATTLHVRDLAGHWHTDMDAIHLLYRAVGLTPLARALNHTGLRELRFGFDRIDAKRGDELHLHVLTQQTYRFAVKDGLAKHFGYGFIERCSNDDCLIAELTDNNSGLNPIQLGYSDG